MMKFINIWFWGLLSLIIISFTSCSDDDLGSSSDLVGSWKLTSCHFYMKLNGEVVYDEEGEDVGEVITFNSDGTIYNDGEVAEWSYEDGKIRLEYGEEVEYVPVKTLTSSKLEIEIYEKETDDGDVYEYYENMVYTKISD